MRLGLYIPVLDERPTGVGVYIEEVCSRLVRRHPDYVVFTGSPGVTRAWLDSSRVRSIGRRVLPVTGLEGPRRRARRLRWLMSDVTGALRSEGIDVLFSPVQEGPFVGEVPAVMVMHDLTALKFPDSYDRLTVAQTRWLVPAMLKRAKRVIAVSRNTRDDLLSTFSLDGRRVVVVGEGFDRTVFTPRTHEEIAQATKTHGVTGRYLLYAGTFSRHKNLGVIASALAALPADVSLVLVGRKDAGAFEEFRNHFEALGLRSRVVTPGYVTRDELAALMSGSSAFVYPSRYEGFGLAPLEAMACGAPVVASNVASLPEVVGEGGVLVPTDSVDAWRAAIASTLSLDRRVVRQSALAQAARFDWDTAVEALSEVLGAVVSERSS